MDHLALPSHIMKYNFKIYLLFGHVYGKMANPPAKFPMSSRCTLKCVFLPCCGSKLLIKSRKIQPQPVKSEWRSQPSSHRRHFHFSSKAWRSHMCPSWNPNFSARRMKWLPAALIKFSTGQNGIRIGGLCKIVIARFSSSGVQFGVFEQQCCQQRARPSCNF